MAEKKTEDQATPQGADTPAAAAQPRKKKRKGRKSGKISKMEAVRRARSELGPDAKPKEIQEYVKKNFKIDMTTDHISTYKGDIQRKAREAGGQSPVKARPGRKPKAAATPAVAGNVNGSGVWSSEDIVTVRALLKRLGGADQAHALIDLCK
jgi:hypothetical protein